MCYHLLHPQPQWPSQQVMKTKKNLLKRRSMLKLHRSKRLLSQQPKFQQLSPQMWSSRFRVSTTKSSNRATNCWSKTPWSKSLVRSSTKTQISWLKSRIFQKRRQTSRPNSRQKWIRPKSLFSGFTREPSNLKTNRKIMNKPLSRLSKRTSCSTFSSRRPTTNSHSHLRSSTRNRRTSRMLSSKKKQRRPSWLRLKTPCKLKSQVWDKRRINLLSRTNNKRLRLSNWLMSWALRRRLEGYSRPKEKGKRKSLMRSTRESNTKKSTCPSSQACSLQKPTTPRPWRHSWPRESTYSRGRSKSSVKWNWVKSNKKPPSKDYNKNSKRSNLRTKVKWLNLGRSNKVKSTLWSRRNKRRRSRRSKIRFTTWLFSSILPRESSLEWMRNTQTSKTRTRHLSLNLRLDRSSSFWARTQLILASWALPSNLQTHPTLKRRNLKKMLANRPGTRHSKRSLKTRLLPIRTRSCSIQLPSM